MAYPEKVYKKANNILSETRQRNLNLFQSRKQEIYNKIPRIKEIEKLLAATGAEVVKLVISNPNRLDELLSRLESTNLSLQMERANLLEKNGYPPTYLEEIYSCPKCKDKGYVGNTMCQCYKKILKTVIYAQMDNSVNIRDFTFQNFSLEYYPKGSSESSPYNTMLSAKQYALEYANNFSPNIGSIIFLGKTGLGKTHLSLAIANVVIDKGFGVMYGSAQNLLYKIEKEKF
ncbi:MAG: ATP-binding protein, partial [Oscillospiraceae bacterium]